MTRTEETSFYDCRNSPYIASFSTGTGSTTKIISNRHGIGKGNFCAADISVLIDAKPGTKRYFIPCEPSNCIQKALLHASMHLSVRVIGLLLLLFLNVFLDLITSSSARMAHAPRFGSHACYTCRPTDRRGLIYWWCFSGHRQHSGSHSCNLQTPVFFVCAINKHLIVCWMQGFRVLLLVCVISPAFAD